MAKVSIKSLAAAAEIVASIAVVISLLLVVDSIDQNTKSLQSVNDNFLYELQNQRLRDVANDGELAAIIDKARSEQDLTNAETLEQDVTAETPDGHASYLEDDPHVTAETSNRLCCDASTSRLVEDEMKGHTLWPGLPLFAWAVPFYGTGLKTSCA